MELELSDLTISSLIRQYIGVRDELNKRREEYQTYEKNAKDLMSRISMALRDKADELGVDNFKTKEGTAYRNMKTSYRVSNWDELIQFIRQTGNYQMLEKRVAKNATAEIHQAMDHIPPGVEYHVEVEFNVRRG